MDNEKKAVDINEVAEQATEMVGHIELLAGTLIGAIITYNDFKQGLEKTLTIDDAKNVDEKLREFLGNESALLDLCKLLNVIAN